MEVQHFSFSYTCTISKHTQLDSLPSPINCLSFLTLLLLLNCFFHLEFLLFLSTIIEILSFFKAWLSGCELHGKLPLLSQHYGNDFSCLWTFLAFSFSVFFVVVCFKGDIIFCLALEFFSGHVLPLQKPSSSLSIGIKWSELYIVYFKQIVSLISNMLHKKKSLTDE